MSVEESVKDVKLWLVLGFCGAMWTYDGHIKAQITKVDREKVDVREFETYKKGEEKQVNLILKSLDRIEKKLGTKVDKK